MRGRSPGADTVKHLQALFREGTFSGLTDGELMRRFTTTGDDSAAAFTALVGRHGPMVLRVCYQVLGDSHDAQDAFQATFLVLARKARRSGKAIPWRVGFTGSPIVWRGGPGPRRHDDGPTNGGVRSAAARNPSAT